MKRVVRSAWFGVLALLLAGGVARAQTPEPLGVVLCVPASAYGEVKVLNEGVPRHTVELLHITQGIFGAYRAQAATVGIRPRSPSPGQLLDIRLPAAWLAVIEAMNVNTELSRVAASGAFVTVRVLQSEQSWALSSTRFLMIPLDALFALQQLNPRRTLTLAHSALLTTGNTPFLVAVVAMDAGNAAGIQIPQGISTTAVLLNTNVRIVNPRAISNGVPVAIIDVNALNPRDRPN